MNREETLSYLSKHEILPASKFGQNFLCNESIISSIIEVSDIKPGDKVLEIGPGTGALTRRLVGIGADVTAVEIDHKLASALKEDLPEANVIDMDFLKLEDYEAGSYDHAISNIPYYVMTPIMCKLMTDLSNARGMTFMVEEAATARIDADVGSKQYGPLAVMCRTFGEYKKEFVVGRDAFVPMPHTVSCVITLKRNNDFIIARDYLKFVEKCFSQRRKKMVNSCPEVKEALEKLGADPNIRAESVDHKLFQRLFAEIDGIML